MTLSIVHERLLHAIDVCSNCFGLSRVERDRPEHPPKTQHPISGHYVEIAPARWSRNQRRTEREYVPSARASASKTIFCECGVSGSYTRARDEIVGAELFRELLKQAIRTLEEKGVSISRKHALKRAMKLGCPNETRFPAYSADEAIAQGIEFGVEMATVRTQSTTAVPAD